MRFIGIGLAAALTLAFMAPAAVSAPKPKKPSAEEALSAKAIERGMAEAPALVTAAGLSCTLAEARWIGEDVKGGQSYYEFSCNPGMGGVLVGKKDGSKPDYFNCLESSKPTADGKPNALACKLAGNADPRQQLAALVAKTPNVCQIDKARSIGASTTNSYFELACTSGVGFILVTSAPPSVDKEVKMNTCLAYDAGGNIGCTMTTRDAEMATVDALAASAGKNCTVKDKRYILSTKTGSTYFEVSCQDGKGYVLERASNGSLARAIDCAAAPAGAECNLTDSREAKTEQASLYTRLAAKAGFQCTVAKYALFPSKAKEEVVELQCANRPDGAVGVFDANGGARFDNCVVSLLDGRKCSYTETAAAYPAITADLKTMGKTSCTVSEARPIGRTPTGDGYLEVGCSDGLPGWVISYGAGTNKPKEVLSCKQASGIGGGCKIANNQRGG